MAKVLIGNLRPPIAKTDTLGISKPDGTTIGIDENGTLSSLVKASGLDITDTKGLTGEENSETNTQALIDAIANKVINELVSKNMISTTIEDSDDKVASTSLVYQLNNNLADTKKYFLHTNGETQSNDITYVRSNGEVRFTNEQSNAYVDTRANDFLISNGSSLKDLLAKQNIINDCNSITKTCIGTYRNTSLNTPQSGTWGMLFTYSGENSTWLFQKAFDTNNRMYLRQNINSQGWTSWRGGAGEWTYVGVAGYKQWLNIPVSNYSEIYIEVFCNGFFTFNIPHLALAGANDGNIKSFFNGGYFQVDTNAYGIHVMATETKVELDFASYGANEKTDAQLYLYYR